MYETVVDNFFALICLFSRVNWTTNHCLYHIPFASSPAIYLLTLRAPPSLQSEVSHFGRLRTFPPLFVVTSVGNDLQLLTTTKMAEPNGILELSTQKKQKYTVADKIKLGKLCLQYKQEYELVGEVQHYDVKRKIWVRAKPKQGYLARGVREVFPDLAGRPNSHPEFQKAKQLALRALADYERKKDDATAEEGPPTKKQFRQPGGGRKPAAPEVREAMFEWFVNVRGALKARLPKSVFRAKCVELYDNYLHQLDQPVPQAQRLQFSNQWIRSWMEEYRISLRHPNKRFSISMAVRKERMVQFVKNILRVRIYFEKKLNIKDVPVINGDQMPLHRNESSQRGTLALKDCEVFVKENYMLSRERVTVYTQASSTGGMESRPQFVFKGKGTILQNRLIRPAGVITHWSPKGSYRLDTMLATIKTLPNLKAQVNKQYLI